MNPDYQHLESDEVRLGSELTFGGMSLDDGWKANFTNPTRGSTGICNGANWA